MGFHRLNSTIYIFGVHRAFSLCFFLPATRMMDFNAIMDLCIKVMDFTTMLANHSLDFTCQIVRLCFFSLTTIDPVCLTLNSLAWRRTLSSLGFLFLHLYHGFQSDVGSINSNPRFRFHSRSRSAFRWISPCRWSRLTLHWISRNLWLH